jgi:hypothetical protein
LVWVKFPLAMMLVMLKLTPAGLLMVMVCGALVVPTPCEPKWSQAGAMALNGVLSSTAISVTTLADVK